MQTKLTDNRMSTCVRRHRGTSGRSLGFFHFRSSTPQNNNNNKDNKDLKDNDIPLETPPRQQTKSSSETADSTVVDSSLSSRPMALLYTLPTGRPIWGLATLGNEQYVARAGSNDIEVYNYASLQRRLTVAGLISARDMTACEQHQCLYVADIGGREFVGYAVHRISVADARVTTWPLDDKPWGVTVTADCTVLVTCSEPALVLEYTTHGRLLREIQLPPEIVHPLHATRLLPVHSSGSGVDELIVCHGDGHDAVHSVGAFRLETDGSNVVGRAISDLQDAATGLQLDVPGHLVMDVRSGTMLVADINNSRIVITSPRLDRLKVVLELDEGRQYPVRLCLDQRRGRLYVAVNGDVRSGRWTSGCVYAFFVYFGANFAA